MFWGAYILLFYAPYSAWVSQVPQSFYKCKAKGAFPTLHCRWVNRAIAAASWLLNVKCIFKPRFVDSEAVRQSIHEREDAYRDAQDYADLPQRGVLPFLTLQESFATRLGSNQLMTL